MSNMFKSDKDQCFYDILAHEKDNPQKYVTLIRGTGNTLEWIDDAKAAPQSYSLPGSGMVESGFYDIYLYSRKTSLLALHRWNHGTEVPDLRCIAIL